MALRKITVDNSVKYIPSANSSPSENSHDHNPRTILNPAKQKKLSQNNKKSLTTEWERDFEQLNNNEMLLLIKKHTDTLVERTKTRPQEPFDF